MLDAEGDVVSDITWWRFPTAGWEATWRVLLTQAEPLRFLFILEMPQYWFSNGRNGQDLYTGRERIHQANFLRHRFINIMISIRSEKKLCGIRLFDKWLLFPVTIKSRYHYTVQISLHSSDISIQSRYDTAQIWLHRTDITAQSEYHFTVQT